MYNYWLNALKNFVVAMHSLPDLSYFAVPGFINQMRRRPVFSASLILYSGHNDNWDGSLSEENAYLYNWLHNRTGDEHDVYLPHTVTPHFLQYNYSHIENMIRPAQLRIKSYLTALGVEDVEDYLKDSDEWLNVLFSAKTEHYRAAEIASDCLGVSTDELPAIIVWTDLESHSVFCILPNSEDADLQEYIKSIYWSLTTAARKLKRKERLTVDKLKGEFLSQAANSHHIKDYPARFRSARILKLDEPISSKLRYFGRLYADAFNHAILNFEELIEHDYAHGSFSRYVSDTRRRMICRLQSAGFEKAREGGKHEIWRHPSLSDPVSLPRHPKISPFVVKSIEQNIQQASQAVA